ncbi:methyltransferase domain-containing protein [Patescibacteria group bacterium]|nr:methyltransferase domain-containing protein [Patescibacteria group bacterium]
MKKIIIVMGCSGSGKTAFAKEYAKKNNTCYLDFDLIFDYKNPAPFQGFLNKLGTLVRDTEKETIIIDGYILDNSPSINCLKELLNANIRLCLCFASPNIVYRRMRAKETSSPEEMSYEYIKRLTRKLYFAIIANDKDPLLIDTTNDTSEIIHNENFPQRWRELVFLSDLNEMTHDKYYQDIELPSGKILKGYSQSHKTWERLSSLVDFSGKNIFDIGCFHGFFSFKAEQAGAKSVTGLEKDERALKTARKLAWLKQSKILFLQGEIENFESPQKYDIVLVLNMLHHVKDIKSVLDNICQLGKTIIFESYLEQEEIILETAARFNLKMIKRINSHRTMREIIVLDGGNNQIIPGNEQRFPFSYSKYRWQKIIKRIKDFKILRPLKILVRKILNYQQKICRAKQDNKKISLAD